MFRILFRTKNIISPFNQAFTPFHVITKIYMQIILDLTIYAILITFCKYFMLPAGLYRTQVT